MVPFLLVGAIRNIVLSKIEAKKRMFSHLVMLSVQGMQINLGNNTREMNIQKQCEQIKSVKLLGKNNRGR